MKKNDNRLAYIKWPGGKVTVELITLSKKGTGFHLKGEFLRKVHWLFMSTDEGYLNFNDDVVRMSLLNHHTTPRWVDNDTIEVSQEADPLYREWKQKTIL